MRATCAGRAELIVTAQARLATLVHGAFPGLTAGTLALVNRLLPAAAGTPEEREHRTGAQSETPLRRSLLTGLTRRAARRNNELVAAEGGPTAPR